MTTERAGLDRLATFVAVAEAGGFTAAAARLGSTKAMVSQHVSRLEQDLATTLFTRTTRKVVLTEAGERLFASVAPLVAGLKAAVDVVSSRPTELSGMLRVTADIDYLLSDLAAPLAEFAAMHPALRLDVLATDAVVDLVAERVDLAVRRGFLRDSMLRSTALGELAFVVIAAPAYVARHGRPRKPEDLAAHRCISLTRLSAPTTWTLARRGVTRRVRVNAAISCSAPLALVALARAGAGIALIARSSVAADLASGRLVELLGDWAAPKGGIYAVYPAVKHVPRKTRALIDFLKRRAG